ncbi:hypothetical protein CF392_12690 [Tamilnaduibacter salinus]|uniref:Uncharacterized protein n=1 Tax=Tamilnaduibacter salinus TaxID=1484056 RepID=A0A2A2I275_9GAMM|nr:hypothetical protein [Tamilnaduibacter salinus]PAV25103.1 hypothetical protein CF392_12690 [Tamilnaduibacter salinus]
MPQPVTWRALLVSNLITLLIALTVVVAALFVLSRTLMDELPDGAMPFRVTLPEGMRARVTNDVDIEVPLKDTVRVPITETLSTQASVDTEVPVAMTVDVNQRIPVNTELRIDTSMEARILGVWTELPVRGSVPIEMSVPVSMSIPIQQTIPLKLDTPVSVALDEDLSIPVDTTFRSPVRMLSPLAIEAEPLVMGITAP